MSATPAQISTSATPILDRLQPMPNPERRAGRSALSIIIWVLLVILVAMTFSFWPPSSVRSLMHDIVNGMNQVLLPGGVGLALFIPFIVVVTFLAVAIHECVHAVVGVLVGFHFNSLRIGPVLFDRPFRISIYHGRGTGAGGWTSLFPVKQDRLILRTIIMLLAGPLSNLISVALLHELPYSKGMFSAWFMYVSLLLGVMNLLPFRNRAVISDGGRILMLLQNRPRGERWLAMLKLLEEIRQGVPQENLSSGFLAKAVAIQDNSPDTFTAHAIAYAAAFWQHKNNEAAQALETCLRYSSVVSPTQRHAIMIDAAVFQARRRKRVDLAEQWLADVPQKTEYPWFRLRGEAAILEAKGDISGALTKLDEVIKLIQATPNQAMREISLRGVSRWKAELLPAITEAASAKSLI